MNEPEHDDIELEISDLPGASSRRRTPFTGAPPFLRALAARPATRMRLWQAATAGCILALLFFTLSGNLSFLQRSFSGLFMHTTPAPAAQPGRIIVLENIESQSQLDTKNVNIWDASKPPVVPQSATLDAAPQSCLQYTLTQNFDSPSFPAGVGGEPMWVTGFNGSHATLNHLTRAQPSQLGWYQQIQLVGETNFNGTITLHGGIAGSLVPLWFGYYAGGGRLIRTVQVNPIDTSISNHTTDDQQWGIFPINLYIARAGCYYLQATWEGGNWIVYFAAGR
ncbi:MAG TPA: hypothetical protein VKR83_21385 [Ktedonobacteraceae bacterium]|nr:hypothetical protein [Ktedonobacteraceae bacterium]